MRFAQLLLVLLLACHSAWAELAIEVHGVDDAMADNIVHHIGTLSDNDGKQPRQLKQKLKVAITEATQALGHYEVHFDYSLEGKKLSIQIDAGPAVVWGAPD